MRPIISAACFTALVTTLGCSSDPASSGPGVPAPDGSTADTDAATGDDPEASPDVLPDSEVGPDSGHDAAPDAGDCNGFVAKPFCDLQCYAPVGCFLMGSPPDEPGRDPLEAQVRVTFDKMFKIMPHEVTIAEWTAEGFPVPTAMTADIDACTDPDCPVTGVTWFEALAFANAFTAHWESPWSACYDLQGCTGAVGEGMVCDTVTPILNDGVSCAGYRVPTSAEWEYAARGGTTTAFYNGPNDAIPDGSSCVAEPHLDSIAWYCDNSGSPPSTHPAGKKSPNPLKLHDMAGNVAEWVSDNYPSAPLEPEPLAGMIAGVSADGPGQVRGGHAGSPPSDCRSAARQSVPKDARLSSVGFRLVQTATIIQ